MGTSNYSILKYLILPLGRSSQHRSRRSLRGDKKDTSTAPELLLLGSLQVDTPQLSPRMTRVSHSITVLERSYSSTRQMCFVFWENTRRRMFCPCRVLHSRNPQTVLLITRGTVPPPSPKYPNPPDRRSGKLQQSYQWRIYRLALQSTGQTRISSLLC